MTLNHAQEKAVAHGEGPCLVLAGPGSGKTLTIAKRIEYLIKYYKVRPEEILVITFTKYAASEMKNRFQKVMGNGDYQVVFGTFHAIFYWIIKWAYNLDQSQILSDGEKNKLLLSVACKLDPAGKVFGQMREQMDDLSEEIGNVKNQCLDIETYKSLRYDPEAFRKVYRAYEEEKQREHKLDFEDMLYQCYQLFLKHPDILKKWQERFRYIMIDEFQDINLVQYRVIRMLAAPENHLFAVGDDDQSIYRFRGARPGIMQQFGKDYPGAKQILLNINYRSTAYIVQGALRVIGYNKNRFSKEILPQKKAEQEIHVQELRDAGEESLYVLGQVQERLKKGVCPGEIAVLFRTAKDARTLAETFSEYQVPFQMRESLYNIYDHFIARDMMSYLRIAAKQGGRGDFLRVANRPNRYIGRDSMSGPELTFDSLCRFYCDKAWMQERILQFEWDMKMLAGKTPYAAMTYLRRKVGYDEFLKEYADARNLDYQELQEQMDEIQEQSKGYETTEEWFDHISQYQETLRLVYAKKRDAVPDRISFLTMHGAKGLEFDSVFIIQANEGSIPYKKAVLEEEIEEERRLFYVAMTRAKSQLVISYCKDRNGKEMQASRFIHELTGSQIRRNDVK